MTAYVIDASVVHSASPLIPDVDDVFAPEIIDLEVASLLRKSVLRQQRDSTEASALFAQWSASSVRRVSHRHYLDAVWALRHNITPYDAAYVALAMRLDIPLITADRRLAAAAAPYCDVVTVD